MRAKRVPMMGFLSMLAATGVVTAPGSFAADTNRVGVAEERIGHGGSYSGSQLDGANDCHAAGEPRRKADMSERIGQGGSIFSFSQSQSAQTAMCQAAGKRVEMVTRIGHGGTTYSFSQEMAN